MSDFRVLDGAYHFQRLPDIPVTPALDELEETEGVWMITGVSHDDVRCTVRVLEYARERAVQRAVAVWLGPLLEFPIRCPRDQVTRYNGWREHHQYPEGVC